MIPADYLKRIRRLEIRSRRLAEEFSAGAYRSVFKGRGLDFEDVRAYADGDDVRFIDWNVTARMRTPFIKRFREERELGVLIAVDVSASGDFGSGAQAKRELAAEVAACLAFSAVANGDRVGLVLFTDRVEKYVPPRKGRLQALRLIREILFFKPAGRGTALKRVLNFVNHVQRRRAIVFLLSDFLDDGFDRALQSTARRHDFVPILLADPRERTLPDVGLLTVTDAETGEQVELDTADATVRAGFAAAAETRLAGLRRVARRGGADLVELETGCSFLQPLQRFLEQRLRHRQP